MRSIRRLPWPTWSSTPPAPPPSSPTTRSSAASATSTRSPSRCRDAPSISRRWASTCSGWRRTPPGCEKSGLAATTGASLAAADDVPKPGGVRQHGIAGERQALERALARVLVAGTAGVGDDDREESEVGGVPDRGLDADFGGDADDRHRVHSAVPEGEFERRADEGRHAELVEDRLAWARLELGNDGEGRRVAEEPGLDLGWIVGPLPGHRHAVLEGAHELLRQRHVAGEEDADPRAAGGREHLRHGRDDRAAMRQLI